MKTCRDCGKGKDEEDFHWEYKEAGKRHTQCKKCIAIYKKKHNHTWRATTQKAVVKGQLSDKRKRNKGARKEVKERLWREKYEGYPDQTCCRCKETKPRSDVRKAGGGIGTKTYICRECNKKDQRKYNITWSITICKAVSKLIERGKLTGTKEEIEIMREELKKEYAQLVEKQGKKCFYCERIVRPDNKGRQDNSASWDALDNEKGHELGNMALVCDACNSAKHEYKTHVFLENSKRIADNLNKKGFEYFENAPKLEKNDESFKEILDRLDAKEENKGDIKVISLSNPVRRDLSSFNLL